LSGDLSAESAARSLEIVDALLTSMIEQQRAKVLRLARQAVPHISSEDVMNPNDYPELKAHPTFDYEDGILAGLISAQVAIRTELRMKMRQAEG
jgi:hypothetical protein